MRLLPAELWWGAIALIIRLFPGVGPDSVARDFGDAPALAIEKVFDVPLAEIEELIVRSRSLVVIEWSHNREIRSVIDRLLQRH